MRKHVLPPKPSQGHQREIVQLCVRMPVCGCFRVRADQQLGVGVSAWMTDHFLLTLPLHLDTTQNKANTRLHTLAKVSGNLQTVFPIISSRVAEKLKEAAMKSRTYYSYYKLVSARNDTTARIFLPPPNHNDSFNSNLRKYILQACAFWMRLKEWKVHANMTSAENKEYSGGWGWKGVGNVVHVRVCVTAKMCVGVPVRMFACDWVL